MSTLPSSSNELRLFQVEPTEAPVVCSQSDQLLEQLPCLPNLIESFETATGWELAIANNGANTNRLEIIDMSERNESGQVAHRRPCDKLVDSINDLITALDDNRELLDGVNQQLCQVVDVPFDWWGISGRSGFSAGVVSKWSICNDERIRVFTASIDGPNDLSGDWIGDNHGDV